MNELDLLREARPTDAPLADQTVSATRNELIRSIRTTADRTAIVGLPWYRKRTFRVAALAGCSLATAAAGWAVLSAGSNLDEPAFTGDTWQLIVGEGSNGDGTFKVCRSFFPPDSDQHGLDTAMGDNGCEVSPVETPGRAMTAVIPALATDSEIVLFIDLTKLPVAEVIIETNTSEPQSVTPFVMPQSGEQVVAVEIPDDARNVSVTAYDHQGHLLQTDTIDNPLPNQ